MGPNGEVVVVSGWGPTADWYRNVTRGGDIHVTIENRTFPATHRVVPRDEAEQVLDEYEHRNRYVRPIVNGLLGYLVGWRYDGSPEARRRLAEQLPLVAFRPARGVT